MSTDPEPIDTTLSVDTPEHVRFSYRLAGPAQRGAAYLIDLGVRGGLAFVLTGLALVGNVFGEEGLGGVGLGLWAVALFALEWGYYVLSEMLMSGQSIGKRALGLRVVELDGLPLRFTDSVLRNILRAADFLPALYAIGLVVMGAQRHFRRLGDLVAGTVVVVEASAEFAPELRIEPPPTVVELAHLPARPPVSREEIEAIEMFLRRIDQLPAAREHELAELLAPTYAARIGVTYSDPVRFLALLYCRATGRGGLAEQS